MRRILYIILFLVSSFLSKGQNPYMTGALINSCNGSCNEGNNEVLFFNSMSSSIKVTSGPVAATNIQVWYGTVPDGTGAQWANYTKSFVSNIAYVNSLNSLAGCETIFYDALTAKTIPVNSIFVIFQNGVCFPYNFTDLCGKGPIYLLFSNDATWLNGGNFANQDNNIFISESRYFRTIIKNSLGTTFTLNYSYYPDSLTLHADGDAISYYKIGGKAHKYFNNGCTPGGTILPIELLSFKAICDNGKIDVYWITASELNNDYFTLYRSINVSSWDEVVKMNGAGTSNTVKDYSYIDHVEDALQLYYKLQQTDYNGSSTFSQIIEAYCPSKTFNIEDVFLKDNKLILTFSSNIEGEYQIKLYNMLGEIVLKTNLLKSHIGINVIEYNCIALAKGIYILSYESKTNSIIKKINYN